MATRLGIILGAAVVWFSLGYFVGKDSKDQQAVPKICPAVANHQVISSSSTKDGEYCTYAQIKGKVLRPVKI